MKLSPNCKEFLTLALTGKIYRQYDDTGKASWRIDANEGQGWRRFKEPIGCYLRDRKLIQKSDVISPYINSYTYELTALGKEIAQTIK